MDHVIEYIQNYMNCYDVGELAKEYKFRALQNSDYANKQYALDMSRERLYAETDKRMR